MPWVQLVTCVGGTSDTSGGQSVSAPVPGRHGRKGAPGLGGKQSPEYLLQAALGTAGDQAVPVTEPCPFSPLGSPASDGKPNGGKGALG